MGHSMIYAEICSDCADKVKGDLWKNIPNFLMLRSRAVLCLIYEKQSESSRPTEPNRICKKRSVVKIVGAILKGRTKSAHCDCLRF